MLQHPSHRAHHVQHRRLPQRVVSVELQPSQHLLRRRVSPGPREGVQQAGAC